MLIYFIMVKKKKEKNKNNDDGEPPTEVLSQDEIDQLLNAISSSMDDDN
jgi:hypothetical protein